ncbi:anti-sigma factor RsbA family regulatory protein [Streptacidiphilus sp. N1-3]|uniref:Anti-sigma factor RsbA family regulatory protein n=1 Tax=Streptacidiphilus alkalitolerans TaxID=3342712 RepID=A0ABV6X215_9ACTN
MSEPGFRHEFYAYRGEDEFLDGALSFINDALAGDETVLVAVAAPKQRLLRDQLDSPAARAGVSFMDLDALGRNPARLIPAWQDWIAGRTGTGRPVRGIGESRWTDRAEVDDAELRYHEWLLNRAFVQSPAWWLLCPYDAAVVGQAVLDAVARCHPLRWGAGAHSADSGYQDGPYAFETLPQPGHPYHELDYGPGQLAQVRDRVADSAARSGLDGGRLRELLIAVTEVATNSINHGGGRGTLRVWADRTDLVCEFHDSGCITDPLIGRVRPDPDQIGGHGMWLVQQLCDLVQIRSASDTGTTIRLHTSLT